MGRIAEKIFTTPADIHRLERLVDELAINARVRLHTVDRRAIEGVVMVTPTVQTFRDPNDDEGINGVVKLEDPARPDWTEYVWLGDIASVEHLDSVTMGSTKA